MNYVYEYYAENSIKTKQKQKQSQCYVGWASSRTD